MLNLQQLKMHTDIDEDVINGSIAYGTDDEDSDVDQLTKVKD